MPDMPIPCARPGCAGVLAAWKAERLQLVLAEGLGGGDTRLTDRGDLELRCPRCGAWRAVDPAEPPAPVASP